MTEGEKLEAGEEDAFGIVGPAGRCLQLKPEDV